MQLAEDQKENHETIEIDDDENEEDAIEFIKEVKRDRDSKIKIEFKKEPMKFEEVFLEDDKISEKEKKLKKRKNS